MIFPEEVKKIIAVKSCGCCCLCRKLSSGDIDVYPIVSKEAGGTDREDNAIPLCEKCASAVFSSKEKYPPEVLKRIRDEWFQECRIILRKLLCNGTEGAIKRELFSISFEDTGVMCRVRIPPNVSPQECINRSELVEVECLCNKCGIVLEKEYDSVGFFSGVRWFVCPSCGLKVTPATKRKLVDKLRELVIKEFIVWREKENE